MSLCNPVSASLDKTQLSLAIRHVHALTAVAAHGSQMTVAVLVFARRCIRKGSNALVHELAGGSVFGGWRASLVPLLSQLLDA